MSPYLIPGERGMALFRHLKDAGVKVTVITNSLAATDVPLVYAGYARYREAMLEAGVDLYELSPTRTQNSKGLGMFGPSLGRLHAKTVAIDRRVVFIGSMNLDPRSADLNTELGIFIESPALAKEMLRIINISKLDGSYRVRRDAETGALQWLTSDGEKEVILDSESRRSGRGSPNRLLGWLVPEELL